MKRKKMSQLATSWQTEPNHLLQCKYFSVLQLRHPKGTCRNHYKKTFSSSDVDEKEDGGRRGKISRGKYLVSSSQRLIKVNWSVERTDSSGSSITCAIVSWNASKSAGLQHQNPAFNDPPHLTCFINLTAESSQTCSEITTTDTWIWWDYKTKTKSQRYSVLLEFLTFKFFKGIPD